MLYRPSFYGQEPQRGNVILPAEVVARFTAPEAAPATERRPEQIAYVQAKAAGATEMQARAAAHQVARNRPGIPELPMHLRGAPVILISIGLATLLLLRRRR